MVIKSFVIYYRFYHLDQVRYLAENIFVTNVSIENSMDA